jgi:hypothetical protein
MGYPRVTDKGGYRGYYPSNLQVKRRTFRSKMNDHLGQKSNLQFKSLSGQRWDIWGKNPSGRKPDLPSQKAFWSKVGFSSQITLRSKFGTSGHLQGIE